MIVQFGAQSVVESAKAGAVQCMSTNSVSKNAGNATQGYEGRGIFLTGANGGVKMRCHVNRN